MYTVLSPVYKQSKSPSESESKKTYSLYAQLSSGSPVSIPILYWPSISP